MPHARRAILAAVIGNVLEWYDFAVYAYMATIIAKQFFPAGDEITSLLSTFAAFGVGFIVRPLGGIVIGRLGDVRGRKAALVLTIVLMAAGTVMIGLIPTYTSIGIAAPLLIVIARLCRASPPAESGAGPQRSSSSGRRPESAGSTAACSNPASRSDCCLDRASLLR